MSLFERAEQAAEQARAAFIEGEIARLEQRAHGLELVLKALCVAHGGVSVPAGLVDAVDDLQLYVYSTDDGYVHAGVEQLEMPAVAAQDEPPLDEPAETAASLPETAERLTEPPEEEPVEELEDSPEARAERYLHRHRATSVARGPVAPGLRPWDDPEDLAFQEVPQPQPPKRTGELAQSDGSVNVTMGRG